MLAFYEETRPAAGESVSAGETTTAVHKGIREGTLDREG